MKNIAPNAAIFSHIPGENGKGKGHDLQSGQGEDVARPWIVWIFTVLNRYLGENFREGKVGRNNSTKIDNPIFGVLHTFFPNIFLLIRGIRGSGPPCQWVSPTVNRGGSLCPVHGAKHGGGRRGHGHRRDHAGAEEGE